MNKKVYNTLLTIVEINVDRKWIIKINYLQTNSSQLIDINFKIENSVIVVISIKHIQATWKVPNTIKIIINYF